jgi:hypothetical protein
MQIVPQRLFTLIGHSPSILSPPAEAQGTIQPLFPY